MELSFQAKQKQNQNLVLSPRMKESLEILQMPLLDLLKKIETEMLENPVLEFDEQNIEIESKKDHFEDFLEDSAKWKYGSPSTPLSWNEPFGSDSLSNVRNSPTFRDYLVKQLLELNVSKSIEKICRYVIESLDEKGYLHDKIEKISIDLNVRTDMVKRAVSLVRNMDPAGVGASSLRECLLLQIERMPETNPAIVTIIDQYLELLADNKIREIAKKLSISVSDTQKYCNRIRQLNPVPSSGFNTETREKFVLPEAIVKYNECGKLEVESNRNQTDRLFINPYYLELAKNSDDAEVRKYLRSNIKRAAFLINDVSGRKKTILRIIEVIVKLQPLYFDHGRTFLKPMSMVSIAKQLSLNESTVSRAIQDKFILSSFGIIPLKSLFASPINTNQDNHVSSSAMVQEKIKEIIKLEDRISPLSDQKIVMKLQQSNISIARRTVAKYRKKLNIPSMIKRKIYD